jgi:hypothetical protein
VVSDETRRQALALAEPMWRSALASEAEALVDSLSKRFPFRTDLLEAIRKQPGLSVPLREKALAAAAEYVPDLFNLFLLSRETAKKKDAGPEAYREALRQARAACELSAPIASYFETLGLAEYRAGNWEKSAMALRQAESLYASHGEAPTPGLLAFLVMAEHRLGTMDSARRDLQRLHATMQKPEWNRQEEALRFTEEAETLFGKGPAQKP